MRLIDATIPAEILDRDGSNQSERRIGEALSEAEALTKLREMAQQNIVMRTMIGQGYYDNAHACGDSAQYLRKPGLVYRYTPYQPEISQGRLEALIIFQTLVKDLTGLISPMLLYWMSHGLRGGDDNVASCLRVKAMFFFVDADTHPQIISVLETHAAPLGWQIIVGKPRTPPRATIFSVFCFPTPEAPARCG